MRRSLGFTLLELVMAIAFASVIIVGLIQAMRSSTRFLATGRMFMQVDRKVALLFNQFEQDLSCAFIPRLHSDPTDDEEKREQKKDVVHFSAKVEDDMQKIGGARRYRLKDAAWVTTSTLRFGRKEPRLARVSYELKKDILTRKETSQLENVTFEEPEGSKKRVVRSAVVCNNVKNLFIEFVVPRKRKDAKEEPPLHTYIWGDTDETKNTVPQYARIYLELWDDEKKHTSSYETMIAIAAFTKPKVVPKPEDAQEAKEVAKEEKPSQETKPPENPAPPQPKNNDISNLFSSLLGGNK